MDIQMKDRFDPVFETMGLLYGSVQDRSREKAVAQLCELGVDGEVFYKKYFRKILRYVERFHKYKTKEKYMDFFFREEEPEFFLLMAVLLVENREWLDAAQIDEDEIRAKAAFILRDDQGYIGALEEAAGSELKNDKEVIRFLSGLKASPELKWHLLEFMQTPGYWMEQLIGIVKRNIPAYEKAEADMEKALAPVINHYRGQEEKHAQELAKICMPGAAVYPSFIGGIAQIIGYTQVYQGIFLDFLERKGGTEEEQKELLMARMKALGDRSKLDILCRLKEGCKYNLELAEALELSASTMSHHMNVLLACGLVGVEKKDARVYYVLREEAVKECITGIEQMFL